MEAFPDLHVHSRQSPDSTTPMAEHCERALEIGLTHLAITDHLELHPDNLFYGRYDYESARAEFDEAAKKYGERLTLLFGVEITYQKSVTDRIVEALEGRDYDVVIGSVHYLENFGGDISSKKGTPAIFARNDPAAVYEDYLERVVELAECGLFDVLGHIGIVHRYATRFLAGIETGRFERHFARIAEAIVKSGAAVEVNASGFNNPPNTTYPDEQFLRELVRAGCDRISVCSDAHSARGERGLGTHVKKALKIVRRCGINEIIYYKNRKMQRCSISPAK